jgi:hypothetical protein
MSGRVLKSMTFSMTLHSLMYGSLKIGHFLGSYVFQSKWAPATLGKKFDENYLLDVQQRKTTLLVFFACIRELSTQVNLRASCQHSIFNRMMKLTKSRNEHLFYFPYETRFKKSLTHPPKDR